MVNLNLELPEGFLDEEVRWDYKITKQMKEVWAVELDLLNELLRVCKKHNIKIFANGGTMLGAVRHKGFIPWDDDIDMMMFREDYEKLCKVAEEEFQKPYFFQTEYTDPGSLRGHAQLRNSDTTGILNGELDDFQNPLYKFNQGIFVDIFPLDNVVENKELYNKQRSKALKYQRRMRRIASISSRYTPKMSHGIKGSIKYIVYHLISPFIMEMKVEESVYARYEKICKMYNNLETECISCFALSFNNCSKHRYKEDYKEIIMMPFEFMEIPVGSNYDHALMVEYGNYHEVVKGGSLHGEVLFDASNSYVTYLK